MDLRENQRQAVIFAGLAGQIPDGTNTELTDRLSPMSQDWEGLRKNFTSLKCKVRARYMGGNQWPGNPLLILEIRPLQELPTTKPPNSETPWHITVGFYEPSRDRAFKKIVEKYIDWEEYTLIGWIQGASFYLDTNACPVGSDPDLQNLIRADAYYGHKPIHISL